MLSIHLHNLTVFAHHGLYEDEKILGNEFEINADISIDAPQTITLLDQTIDYVAVCNLIKERMAIPTPLLETVVQELIEQIHSAFPSSRRIFISIRKKYPPLLHFEGSVGVSCTKEF